MSQKDVRQSFLQFFKGKGHTVVPSDSLIPSSDPTLLFTSAGMVQFKAHFLQQIPLTFTRAASSQRCLRTTDIEQVGLTARHLTFFEMLGNFSFGDYFKEDAIAWAWEFFTKELSLDKKRLWVSIYREDDEAHAIWKKIISENRIVRMGEDSNFWTMGPTGPCGPCSEIYWDRGNTPSVTGPDETDRWMEIWNLVFTQFDRQADGKLLPLPKKNIDTGMGLERLTSVVEGVPGNFETSLLKPLIQFGEETFKYKLGTDPKRDVSLRIVADHLRAVTFLVYDGVLPSNEGRGYVLRRLLRRATRQGTLFGKKEPFLFWGVPIVSTMMSSTASELLNRQQNIAHIVREEEERFLETMETGSEKLRELVDNAKKSKSISGQEAFRLYDTYGFPPEVTKEILAETGMSFDDKEFSKAQTQAQDLAREGWKGSGAKDITVYNELQKKIGPTQFVGYDSLTAASPILAMLKDGKSVTQLKAGETGEVITSTTPFYPEGGGQVGDKGWIKAGGSRPGISSPGQPPQSGGGAVLADVLDVQKPINNFVTHIVKAHKILNIGDKVEFAVDKDSREPTMRHHTATHLLHAALRKILGTTVTQAGSLVEPERLRFDYTYNKPLTPEQIAQVEHLVNFAVLENWKVTPKVFPADQARKMGAMALFGEKYGNEVRCLLISGKGFEDFSEAFSLELCGGTHVSATGDIGAFKIVSDTSLAAGVRRIEALAGFKSLEYFNNVENILSSVSEKLKAPPKEVDSRLGKILERQKQLEQEVRDLKLKLVQGGETGASQPAVQVVKGINLAIKVTEGLEAKDLRTLADRLKEQIKSGVVFAASTNLDEGKEKISFVFTVTPDMKAKGLDAGKLAKAAAAELGGSGGGRPDFAQGGGEGNAKLQALVQKIPSLI